MKNLPALTLTLLAAMAVPALAQPHGAKQLDDAFTHAFNANDLNAVVALYAPDATLYPPDGMEWRGIDAIRRGFTDLLSQNTVKDFRIQDAHYATSGDVSTGWGRFTLTMVPKAGGAPIRMDGRATTVARRVRGKWLYVSDHASVPLSPPSPGFPRPASLPSDRR